MPGPGNTRALMDLPETTRTNQKLSVRQKQLSTKPGDFLWPYGECKSAWSSVRTEVAREFPNVKEVDLRDLRYTYRAWSLEAGVDPYVLADLMGHRLDVATDHYRALNLDAVLARLNSAQNSEANIAPFEPRHTEGLKLLVRRAS